MISHPTINAVKFQEKDTYVINRIKVSTLSFTVPLDYNSRQAEQIQAVVKLVNKYTPSSPSSSSDFDLQKDVIANKDAIIVFLQGGPGFPSPIPTSPTSPSYLKPLLDRGFTVLLLDQRGTGMSTPIDGDSLRKDLSEGSVESTLERLTHFRADSIIYDCESIRKTLLPPGTKWTLLGQSYGGFCSITYASFFPESLKQILLTGGLPPLTATVDDVYRATYQRTIERERAYFNKYPQDIKRISFLCAYIDSHDIKLPNMGDLTSTRLKHLGMTFGGKGGSAEFHSLLITMELELVTIQKFSYSTLNTIQNYLGFETNILYYLFQEAIYLNGSGLSSNWSASRNKPHCYDDPTRCNFLGEMVFPEMYEEYNELRGLEELSNAIHEYDKWGVIYDVEKLSKIRFEELPIVAAVYVDDQYVDYGLSKGNLEIFEFKMFVTNEYFHNGLRTDPEVILGKLFGLLQDGEVM